MIKTYSTQKSNLKFKPSDLDRTTEICTTCGQSQHCCCDYPRSV